MKIWPYADKLLAEALDLEAKALFEYLGERAPLAGNPEPLRTFQRRVQQWRQQGPDQEVFFPQDWAAGRAMQLDWTNADELAVTIAGLPRANASNFSPSAPFWRLCFWRYCIRESDANAS